MEARKKEYVGGVEIKYVADNSEKPENSKTEKLLGRYGIDRWFWLGKS